MYRNDIKSLWILDGSFNRRMFAQLELTDESGGSFLPKDMILPTQKSPIIWKAGLCIDAGVLVAIMIFTTLIKIIDLHNARRQLLQNFVIHKSRNHKGEIVEWSSIWIYWIVLTTPRNHLASCFLHNWPGVGCCFLLKLEYYSSENFLKFISNKQKFTIIVNFCQVKLSHNEYI